MDYDVDGPEDDGTNGMNGMNGDGMMNGNGMGGHEHNSIPEEIAA
jgi:hypothetical protein